MTTIYPSAQSTLAGTQRAAKRLGYTVTKYAVGVGTYGRECMYAIDLHDGKPPVELIGLKNVVNFLKTLEGEKG